MIFIKGLLLGFSIAAPVGPIGILCIRRSMAQGWGHGLATGLGAATADALFGTIAAFGLSVISDVLVSAQAPLQIVGGVFLGYLSVGILKHRTHLSRGRDDSASPRRSYLSTVLLTLSNPATILSFVAAFSVFNFAQKEMLEAGLMVLGVFVGSALWWLSLSYVSARLKTRIHDRGLLWVNRVSGTMLLFFSILAFFAGLIDIFEK